MNPDNDGEKWNGSISEYYARDNNIKEETILLLRIDGWDTRMRKPGLRN
jgi:hypothetical protein